MIGALARNIMFLAVRCLGEARREWALAMQAELEMAIDEGKPLTFACGCLVAAWREMPRQEEGRFVVANYALALGVFIPISVFQFACAGLPYFSAGGGAFHAMLMPGSAQQLYMSDAYPAATPVILAIWLLLGVGQLRLAWVLLECDWAAVVSIGAMTVAASATLVIFTGVLFLDDAGVRLQAVLAALELVAVYSSARWHARLCPGAPSAKLAD